MLVEVAQSFRAMNTDVESVACLSAGQEEAGKRALSRVKYLFTEVEKTLSRFNPDSELSCMNARAGHPFEASSLLFDTVAASLDVARATDGLFDPTILSNLLAAGYDRSFDELTKQDNDSPGHLRQHRYSWHDISLDHRYSMIKMPEGCGLDLGGIGKGWTVDRACRELRGFFGFAIDAGGDIMVGGTRTDGTPWTIGVADPFESDHDLLVLELTRGAVCTSTTVRRRWQVAGHWRHHLIDPRTGQPSESNVVSATVITESATMAETIAKASIILGAEAGIKFIERQAGVQGLLVLSNGEGISSAGFQGARHVA